MTTKKNSKKEPSKTNLYIPSRTEFHRYASNILSVCDFDTDYPSGYQSDKVYSAISWTKTNEKKRNSRLFY